jgi:hypothetical protein
VRFRALADDTTTVAAGTYQESGSPTGRSQKANGRKR